MKYTKSMNTSVVSKRIGFFLAFLFCVVSLAFTVKAADPTGDPPTGNTSPPVNVGVTSQVKTGGISMGSLIVSGGSVFGGNLQLTGNWLSSDGDSEGIFVDTSGSVGIGISTPAAMLSIVGQGTGASSLDLQNNTGNYFTRFMRDGVQVGEIYKNTGGALTFTTAANQSTNATFNFAGGSVGVGAPVPTAGLLLDVEGKVGATEYCDELGSNCFDAAAVGGGGAPVGGVGETNYIPVFTSSTTLATSSMYDDGTYVSIGTSTPTQTFQVSGGLVRVGLSNINATETPGSSAMELMEYAVGDRHTLVDMHASDAGTQSDYAARMVRWSGENSSFNIRNKGTGELALISEDAAYINLYTSNLSRMVINPSGLVGIGTTGPTEQLEVNGNVLAVAYLYSSDERLKKNISPYQGGQSVISELNPVSYDWRNESKGSDIGLLAQEVQKVFPNAVRQGTDGYLSIDYARLVVPLISAVQNQNEQIQKLEEELRELKQK